MTGPLKPIREPGMGLRFRQVEGAVIEKIWLICSDYQGL